jgi:hypothetical protein
MSHPISRFDTLTMSELMDAIRQEYPDAELDSECIFPDARWLLWTGSAKGLRCIPGPTATTATEALAALCKKVLP